MKNHLQKSHLGEAEHHVACSKLHETFAKMAGDTSKSMSTSENLHDFHTGMADLHAAHAARHIALAKSCDELPEVTAMTELGDVTGHPGKAVASDLTKVRGVPSSDNPSRLVARTGQELPTDPSDENDQLIKNFFER